MKTLYKCLTLLLALGWSQISLANNPPPKTPPPPPKVTSITVSGTPTSTTLCRNVTFTATANVSNERSTDRYRWGVAIGEVTFDGVSTADFVTANKTVSVRALRAPGSSGIIRLSVTIIKSNGAEEQNSGKTKDFTLLPDTPATPGFISVQPDNPNSPTNTVICQNSGATFSVAATAGAIQYLWTVNGSTTTTSSRFFSTFFNTTGSKTVSVRARGCGGSTSGSTSISVNVIPSSNSPCNGPLARTASPSFEKQPDSKLSVSTYPNPVVNELNIDVSNDYLSSVGQLVDQQTGKTVKSFTLSSTQSTINTSDLPRGTYLFKVSNQNGVLTRRLIIE